MSLSTIGRRFERLLFFAAPLSLGSLLTLFVVFASETQKERVTARCYEQAARLVESKSAIAEALWDGFLKRKGVASAERDYVNGLRQLLVDATLSSSCYKQIVGNIVERSKQGPSAFIETLHADAKRLSSVPISYSGVDLPEKANISLLGTTASIELRLFANLLQVVLAPLLFLWLGSLYNTRYRETLLISNAKQITEVFPHLVNVYPAVRYPEPKRRSRVQPHLRQIFAVAYALIRIILMAMFIAPAVIAYIAGMVLIDEGQSFGLLTLLVALVGVFAIAVLLCELLPWHYSKTFPGPPLFPPKV